MHFVSRQVGRPTFTDPYSFPRFIKEKTPVCGGGSSRRGQFFSSVEDNPFCLFGVGLNWIDFSFF